MNKKRALQKQRKFFIIVTAYIAIFIVTIGITLSWFSDNAWSDGVMYMGGPVYMDFQDNDGNTTSGAGSLVMNLPPNWQNLYPSMNINIEASALLLGSKKEHVDGSGVTNVVSTQAILRARIMVEARSPSGEITPMSKDIVDPIMEELNEKAEGGVLEGNDGKWFLEDPVTEGDRYFYYVKEASDKTDMNSSIMEVANADEQGAVVTFLDHAVVGVPWQLSNDYAGYSLTITIVFQALQAFIPYTLEDVGVIDHHSENRKVNNNDVGLPRPAKVSVVRPIFDKAFLSLYEDDDFESEL